MKHVAMIGECMIELNGIPFGSMQQTFGGDTLNTAIYLARCCNNSSPSQQITVSYLTAIGEDPISTGMLQRWQEEGINTGYVLRDPKRTPGIYLIQIDESGERTFLYWRNQSAARYLLQHPEFTILQQSLKRLDMLFLSGISLAILPPADCAKLLQLLQQLKQSGVEIAFDSNFRPALWLEHEHLSTVQALYQTVFRLTDLALVTFDDEQLLWNDATPEATLERLRALGVSKAVVKLGKEGCLLQDFTQQDTPQWISTTPVTPVIDTTAAGDSFNAGFLSAYLMEESMETACQRGNGLAGAVIQHPGAIVPRNVTQTLIQSW